MLMPEQPSITMTLGELVEAEDALNRLLEVKLTAQLAYSVATLTRHVKAETAHFHTKREELIRELGEPMPDNAQMMRVKPMEVPGFLKRMQELTTVEATLTVKPLRLEELPDMTGADLLKLGALLTAT